jgi:putative ABC transport system substrate-binding protein
MFDIRRRECIGLLGGAAAWPFAALAQRGEKVARIGYLRLGRTARDPRFAAFRAALSDLGYIEDRNIIIEVRRAEDRSDLPELAMSLIRLPVDVIVASDSQATRAASTATQTIPIVMRISGDPVATGFVPSLARPGGNVTGVTSESTDISGKRVEILKELVPRLRNLAMLWDPVNPGASDAVRETEAAARTLGLTLKAIAVHRADDLEKAFAEIARERIDALVALPVATITVNRERIVELAARARLPTMFQERTFAQAGGLSAYGPDFEQLFRRMAVYVDRILKGARPADLPVEQPTKFELVVNLKTARALGLDVPPTLLARADEVIE